jgi:peptidoglycan/LPS O-acetylase OafA/YrhL
MTSTATFTAPTTPQAHAANSPSTTKSLWKTGALAGVAASAATFATAAVAHAVDVPLTVGGKSIPLLGFAQLTLVASIIGTLLAVVLSHRVRRPQHTFVVTTVALTLVSIVPDVLANAQTATKFALALTHVVAAAIVIPALASRLDN